MQIILIISLIFITAISKADKMFLDNFKLSGKWNFITDQVVGGVAQRAGGGRLPGNPGIRLDDLAGFRFRKGGMEAPPLRMGLDACHPFRVGVREFFVAGNLDPVTQLQTCFPDALGRSNGLGLSVLLKIQEDRIDTFRSSTFQALQAGLFGRE